MLRFTATARVAPAKEEVVGVYLAAGIITDAKEHGVGSSILDPGSAGERELRGTALRELVHWVAS